FSPLLRTATEDERVAQFPSPRLQALGLLAPRRGRMAPAGALALAAAPRMVHRGHRHPSHARIAPEPAHAPGLAVGHVLVIEVADLADHRPAQDVEPAHLPRGQPQLRVLAFLGHELAEGPRRAGD